MHAANIAAHSKLKLVAVHDMHGPSAEKLASEFGVPAYSDVEEIFSNSAIESRISRIDYRHAHGIHRAFGRGRKTGSLREAY